MIYIGIDPGKSGGITTIKDNSEVEVFKIPYNEDGVDAIELKNFFKQLHKKNRVICMLEKIWGNSASSGFTEFSFGESYGMLKASLIFSLTPFQLVAPKTWMAYYSINKHRDESRNDWKNRLKKKAMELFPGVKVTLWNADALLIANYCREVS